MLGNRTAIDATRRAETLTALSREPFDVLVVGAGITGCGIARDAAMRGLSVALVDAADIGAGTSSRSSKLIHGGARYLAQGQFDIVREAAVERRVLRRLAPHLAVTNPMIVLTETSLSRLMLRTGLWLYDRLGGVAPDECHQVWRPNRIATAEPIVAVDRFCGAVVYPEYLTDDARLTLANARSAAGYGACVGTYLAVERLLFKEGRVGGARVRDRLDPDADPFEIEAGVVVNAAGIWLDRIRRMEDPTSEPKLQITKGIHLVFPRTRLPLQRTLVWYFKDGRGIFAIPREETVYVGTTDTFYPTPVYWPEIDRADIGYLLEALNAVLKIDPLTTDDVVTIWAGLRPLLKQAGKKPSEISRRNEILEGSGGLLSVAGGKLTSYRSMAERVVNRCEQKLGKTVTQSTTAEITLPGGDLTETPKQLSARITALTGAPVAAERLVRLYGSEALQICDQKPGVAAEAEFAVRVEGALTLEDYWVRRSARADFDPDGGLAALEPAVAVMGDQLGWSETERRRQVADCRERRCSVIAALSARF
jgi:glycerol-3-phosphate dehydrogenase